MGRARARSRLRRLQSGIGHETAPLVGMLVPLETTFGDERCTPVPRQHLLGRRGCTNTPAIVGQSTMPDHRLTNSA